MDVRISGKLRAFVHEKHKELLRRIIQWSTCVHRVPEEANRYSNLTITRFGKQSTATVSGVRTTTALEVENLPKAPPPKAQMELPSVDGEGRKLK